MLSHRVHVVSPSPFFYGDANGCRDVVGRIILSFRIPFVSVRLGIFLFSLANSPWQKTILHFSISPYDNKAKSLEDISPVEHIFCKSPPPFISSISFSFSSPAASKTNIIWKHKKMEISLPFLFAFSPGENAK